MSGRVSFAIGMLVVGTLATGVAQGGGLGSKLEAFTLADQYGTDHLVDENVRMIILTRDMKAGDVVREALGNRGKPLLEKHQAVYIADLSSMPGFLRNLLAVPKLKERPYPILLDTAGDVSNALPSRESHATLIFLDALQIAAVEYVSIPASLLPALEAPKRFAAH
jgi:hypothetical protein